MNFDFGLGDTIDMLRDSVRQFAAAEIAPLASQASPDVAIVTAVAPAHLEAFDDGLPGIARENATRP